MRALLCLAVAACSQPARAPRAEQIVTLGDATYHVRADGNVDVTVTRTFGDAHGSGHVLLVGADLDEARRSPHLRLAGARAWRDIANTFASTPQRAYQVASRGLDELGTEYARRGVVDDTDNFVLMARSEIETNPTHAASIVLRTLDTRIRLYLQRYHPRVQ